MRRALAIEPQNAAANFNLGLLMAEQSRRPEAEQALRTALKSDPQMAPAAYNLGVLLAEGDLAQAVAFCRKAHQLRPDDVKYARTLAFYLQRQGNLEGAIAVLRPVVAKEPPDGDACLLLGELYQERRDLHSAADAYRRGLLRHDLPAEVRSQLQSHLRAVQAKP